MSTLAEHIQRLCLFRRLIQPGDNAALLLEDQEFRKEALVLCSVHLDELAALATPPAEKQPVQQDTSGWRPIATAPKNTPVRLYAQHGGFYDEDFNPSGSVEGHWTDGIGWSGAFWDSVHDTWFRREGIVPTHWQPLPEPMAGDPGATPPAEKQAAPSGEDNHG